MPRARRVKVCPGCWEEKDAAGFDRNRAKPDGLDVYCKACKKARRPQYDPAKAQAYRDDNREHIRAYGTSYMADYRQGKRRRQTAKP